MLICQYLLIFLLPVLSLYWRSKVESRQMRRNCDVIYYYYRQHSVHKNLMLAASMECGTERKDFACISRCRCHTGSGPTVCPFRCTNCRQIKTFASEMQANSPLWARAASTLWPAHGI